MTQNADNRTAEVSGDCVFDIEFSPFCDSGGDIFDIKEIVLAVVCFGLRFTRFFFRFARFIFGFFIGFKILFLRGRKFDTN